MQTVMSQKLMIRALFCESLQAFLIYQKSEYAESVVDDFYVIILIGLSGLHNNI